MFNETLNETCKWKRAPTKVEKDKYGFPLIPIEPDTIPCRIDKRDVPVVTPTGIVLSKKTVYVLRNLNVGYEDTLDGRVITDIAVLKTINKEYIQTEVTVT